MRNCSCFSIKIEGEILKAGGFNKCVENINLKFIRLIIEEVSADEALKNIRLGLPYLAKVDLW